MLARIHFSAGPDPELTAVILCGGRGERLRPLTDVTPKPLLPVNGRPLLAYLIEHLSGFGIRDFILCVGYKAEQFEDFARRYSRGSGRIRCLNSGAAGISERLADACAFIPGRALVCYGDTLADVDLQSLTAFHTASGAEATLTAHPYRSPFGIVQFDKTGLAHAFEEKPQLPHWINIGFLLLEQAALDGLRPNLPFQTYLAALAARRVLRVHCHHGRHWTANTETELRELASELQTHWNHHQTNEIARD